jgi:hypothetical protein
MAKVKNTVRREWRADNNLNGADYLRAENTFAICRLPFAF